MELQKLVSFKVIGFGILSIIVVLFIGYFQFTEIKRSMRNRKII
jgi:hypothetical protein